ncbi:MAG: hypothetical protein AAF685_08810 [Cyanobacteria bacterium P01_C01_bin.89]
MGRTQQWTEMRTVVVEVRAQTPLALGSRVAADQTVEMGWR